MKRPLDSSHPSRRWRWGRRVQVAVLPLSLVVAVWLNLETRHEGKTLSEWVAQGSSYYEGGSDDDTAQALRAMGGRVLPTLLDWLQTRESRLKQKIEILADRQSLIELQFESAELRRGLGVNGIRLLGTNAVPAIPTLVGLIEDPELGGAALSGLAAIGVPAWPTLMSTLTNRLPVVRSAAIGLLGSDPFLDQPGTVATLLRQFHDGDPQVQMSALGALAQCERHPELINPAIARVAADTNSPNRAAAINLLAWADADSSISLPVFLAAMENGNADVRRRAVTGLVRIESKEVMEALINALNDSEPVIRARAAKTVGRYLAHSDRIIPLLHGLLTNDYPFVRGAAATGLSKFGPAACVAVPDLLRLYEEGSPFPPMLKQMVARSLLAIDPVASAGAGIKPEDYPLRRGDTTNAFPRPRQPPRARPAGKNQTLSSPYP